MTPARGNVEQTLRRILLGTAAGAGLGIVLELWLLDHIGSVVQIIPFALVGLIWIAVVAAWRRGVASSVRLVRTASIVVLCGAVFGTYQHGKSNYEFSAEVYPDQSKTAHLKNVLTGASPLLAPGTLVLASLLCLGATYRPPERSAADAQ